MRSGEPRTAIHRFTILFDTREMPRRPITSERELSREVRRPSRHRDRLATRSTRATSSWPVGMGFEWDPRIPQTFPGGEVTLIDDNLGGKSIR